MSEGLTDEAIERIRKISDIKSKVTEVLKLIHDPEIPVNIWDLGLIYKIEVNKNNKIRIEMTLTSPTCPVAGYIPPEVEARVKQVVLEAKSVEVELVWEPSWDQSMMSEEAKIILNMM
ncbi:MAG: DUF59 domain-containing protein [Rickettsiales bacterium]|nr:DUF59 domain-containing protein [Rickettsiales bacterium]